MQAGVCRPQKSLWWHWAGLLCQAASSPAVCHTWLKVASGHSGLLETLCLRQGPRGASAHFKARNRAAAETHFLPGDIALCTSQGDVTQRPGLGIEQEGSDLRASAEPAQPLLCVTCPQADSSPGGCWTRQDTQEACSLLHK